MEELGAQPRMPDRVDTLVGTAYGSLVTINTSMETEEPPDLGEAIWPSASAEQHDPAIAPLHEAPDEQAPRGLSVYSRQRFLAVVRGILPPSEYSREVARHVDDQLARRSASAHH